MTFSDVLVMDVMTPRTVVFSLNADKTIGEVISNNGLQTFSRFPIWEGETIDDKIVGYVLSKDVFHEALNGNKDKKLKDFARDVYIIPETADLSVALEKFLKRRQHLFIAVDEYGGVSGLITMEDVLETILGVEILDEADKITDLRKLAVEKRDNRVKMKISGNS
jgi:CBS domain containing-hemolysin-like protein